MKLLSFGKTFVFARSVFGYLIAVVLSTGIIYLYKLARRPRVRDDNR